MIITEIIGSGGKIEGCFEPEELFNHLLGACYHKEHQYSSGICLVLVHD